jgi:hypothetical protein
MLPASGEALYDSWHMPCRLFDVSYAVIMFPASSFCAKHAMLSVLC